MALMDAAIRSTISGASKRPAVNLALVYQPSLAPISIDPSKYANALSPTNPQGDMLALRRFYDSIGNAVPNWAYAFAPSQQRVDRLYGALIQGARPADHADMQAIIAKAKQTISLAQAPPVVVGDTTWVPTYPDQDDWSNPDQMTSSVSIALNAIPPGTGSVSTIGQPAPITWSFVGYSMQLPVATTTTVFSIGFSYRVINLVRPWWDWVLINSPKWSADGIVAGGISDPRSPGGKLMPLVPTAFVVAKNIALTVKAIGNDARILSLIAAKDWQVNLGQIQFGRTQANLEDPDFRAVLSSGSTASGPASEQTFQLQGSAIQILGWVSAKLPKLPPR